MEQHRSLRRGLAAVTLVILGAGCGRQVAPEPEGIVLVPAREALGGFRIAEVGTAPPLPPVPPPPVYPPPSTRDRPEIRPPAATGQHPEWAVRNAHAWRYIVIHHSATDRGSAATFDRYHHQRGWENGLGYHFVIGNGTESGDGQVEIGGRWRGQIQGAHAGVPLYNDYGIGICLVGDFERDRPTPRQLAALVELVNWLATAYRIPRKSILRHRDVKSTDCPGKNFPALEYLFGK